MFSLISYVDWAAHVGGLIQGILLGITLLSQEITHFGCRVNSFFLKYFISCFINIILIVNISVVLLYLFLLQVLYYLYIHIIFSLLKYMHQEILWNNMNIKVKMDRIVIIDFFYLKIAMLKLYILNNYYYYYYRDLSYLCC